MVPGQITVYYLQVTLTQKEATLPVIVWKLNSHIAYSIYVYLIPLTIVILILTHGKVKLNKTLCDQNVGYLQKIIGFVLVLFDRGDNIL